MKKVNEVFFGEHGLTSTSANHLANIAQEKGGSAMLITSWRAPCEQRGEIEEPELCHDNC